MAIDKHQSFVDFHSYPYKLYSTLKSSSPDVDTGIFLCAYNKTGQLQNLQMEANDSGYILISAFDMNYGQFVVKLFSLSTKAILHVWIPDLKSLALLPRDSSRYFSWKTLNKRHFRIQAPVLLGDLSLFVKGKYGAMLLDSNSTIKWYAKGVFHHSAELDSYGNFWVPSVNLSSDFDSLQNFTDDAICALSQNGKEIFRKSVSKILIENGYFTLVWGMGKYDGDPIHLNDIQPALKDSKYWRKGDLLLSLRNRSTVCLYRPSEDKILWLKSGPWINQHDVSFVDDHTISVFSNDVVRNSDDSLRLLYGVNRLYCYDFNNAMSYTPFVNFFKRNQIATLSEGRAFINMVDTSVFVEETNFGRLVKGTNVRNHWTYVNRIPNTNRVSLTGWCRYYSPLPK